MYDAVTTALIQSTPALPELDREALPDRLSRAYAEIAAARVRLREDGPDAGLEEIIDFATRLAQTNEALVAISPDRDDRASAAFVAATAYQLIFQAERVGGTELDGSVLWQSKSPNMSGSQLAGGSSASLCGPCAGSRAARCGGSRIVTFSPGGMSQEIPMLKWLHQRFTIRCCAQLDRSRRLS